MPGNRRPVSRYSLRSSFLGLHLEYNCKENPMNLGRFQTFVMSAALVLALPAAFAQTTEPAVKTGPLLRT